MHKFMDKLRFSLLEMKNLYHLVLCAMLGAVAIVLGSLSIQVGNYIRIGFSGIPNQLVAALFGPVTAGIFGGIMDIVKFILKPTGPYFPGFTISAVLGGIIYGFFYYVPMVSKQKISFWRILIAEAFVAVFVNILLGTYWLSILYGKGFLALLPARALKNVIMTPINSLIFYTVYNSLLQLFRRSLHHA